MAGKAVTVGVEIDVDAKAAAQAFDATADAAEHMGKAVEAAGDQAKRGTEDVNRAAEASDNLASKSSQATGGLGALASGFELVGADQYAVGLQAAAMATDFFSGVGDIANLVLESQAVQTAKNAVLKAKDVVVTTAQGVATKATAAAQWLLNAAMEANPIGLVVVAVVALTAAFVVAYKKSETFRNVVNGALNAVKKVAGNVIDWLKSHWKLILAILTGPFGLAVVAIAKNWDKITGAAKKAVDTVKSVIKTGFDIAKNTAKDAIDGVVGFVTDAPGRILNVGQRMFNAGKTLIGKFLSGLKNVGQFAADLGTAIVNGMIHAINAGIDFINNALPNEIDLPGPFDIDLPDNPIPRLPEIGQGLGSSGASTIPSNPTLGTTTVQIVVQGAVDPLSTATQVKELIDRSDGWNGQIVHTL